MKNKLLFFLLIILFSISCDKKNRNTTLNKPLININVIDNQYVVDDSYSKGDVRRYGLFPNRKDEILLKNILKLAEKGLPIHFPEGYFPINIILKGRSNIDLHFKNTVIGGALQVINDNETPSSKIAINGELTILDKVFVRKSNNISFDTINVKTDTTLNIYKTKNKGVSIYSGSNLLFFHKLSIVNTGGQLDDAYKYTASALQIHGWNNNPEDLTINYLSILNADRTALYITGNNHKIFKTDIINFGLGTNQNMQGLEDADLGQEKEFSGVWINRCNDCTFDTISISNKFKKGNYSLRLDEGVYEKPTFIYNIRIREEAKNLEVLADKLTNILVKNEY